MVGGDGLGDGGQPLLSASIREPRGDTRAGKTGGGEFRAGSGPRTSHPSALEYTCFQSRTPHHLLTSSVHLFSMQMCNPEAAGFLNIFFYTGRASCFACLALLLQIMATFHH